jgi:hypothetical protein
MIVFRIKNEKTGKFYRGRSKFTKFGSFFSLDHLKKNLPWVKRKFGEENLKIIEYEVKKSKTYDLKNGFPLEKMKKIINRKEKINELFK